MTAVATTLETKVTHCLPNAQFPIRNAADDVGVFKAKLHNRMTISERNAATVRHSTSN
ncbi:hypothetical protein ACQFX9_21540 [Aliinostoc sp. HNIBRCY26]|uniref:hypothetical protein n=1 Tax=Aliinostoc sp. HNIBRCY26 TaxID=3418997 RepID=UPI003CFF6602